MKKINTYWIEIIFQTFPPVHAISSLCSVGEDGVGLERCHCHGIGLPVGSRTDTEESKLWVNTT